MMNPFAFYFDGDSFFEQLKKDLQKAKSYIYIEFYIFQFETIGKEILHILKQKRLKNNVKIKILVDGIGSREYTEKIQKEIQGTQIEFAIYKPLIFKFLIRKGYHRRNHRKLILIDDKILYTGGMNIKDTFSQKLMGENHWRDTMIRIGNSKTNPEIRNIFYQAKLDFLSIWQISKKGFYFLRRRMHTLTYLQKNQNYIIFSSVNRKRQIQFRKFFFQFIQNTKKFLYIATPYFIPPLRLIRILKSKAESGVDVQIMTAGNTDVWLARQAGRAIYSTLLKSGVKILEFRSRIFHSKHTINENGVIVGSSNIDYRSFLHNLEIDMFLADKTVIEIFLDQWKKDEEECEKIIYPEWKRRPLLEKITESFAYGFRYYL